MAAAEVSTAADLAVSMEAVFASWVGFTVAGLAGSMLAGPTVIGFTMADSTTIDFTIAGFSSVEGSHIPGGVIIRTMGTTITANPTAPRPGITVPILPAITLM
jgi:hypothetical protein